jgi:MFS family permease
MTILGATNFIAQPIFGYLTDNYISEKKLFIICSILTIPTLFLLQASIATFWALIATTFLLGIFLRQFVSVIDSWTVKIRTTNSDINYGLTRGMGSLSFAISALVFGKIFEIYSLEYIFISCAGFVVVSIIVALSIDKSNIKKNTEKKAGFKIILKNPRYKLLLISGFLCTFSLSIAITYFPLLLESKGGTSGDLGISLFITALSEVPVMLLLNRFANRIKIDKLLLIALLFYIFRVGSMLLAPNLTILIAVQSIQSLSFGLYYPTAIIYIYEIIDSRFISTAIMTFSSFTMAISAIIASSIGGLMIDSFGIYSIYVLGTATAIIAFIIFIVGQYTINKQVIQE